MAAAGRAEGGQVEPVLGGFASLPIASLAGNISEVTCDHS